MPSIPASSGLAPVPASAFSMLDFARRDLCAAALAPLATQRYAAAHRGALHASAAVLAVRARPSPRQRGPRSAWVLLAQVAPELGEWAQFFAAGAGKRAAAEAGLTRAVTSREADDLLRDAETFLSLVVASLGLSSQPPLPRLAPQAS